VLRGVFGWVGAARRVLPPAVLGTGSGAEKSAGAGAGAGEGKEGEGNEKGEEEEEEDAGADDPAEDPALFPFSKYRVQVHRLAAGEEDPDAAAQQRSDPIPPIGGMQLSRLHFAFHVLRALVLAWSRAPRRGGGGTGDGSGAAPGSSGASAAELDDARKIERKLRRKLRHREEEIEALLASLRKLKG